MLILIITRWRIDLKSFSFSTGVRNKSNDDECFIRGNTLTNIIIAMHNEHNGSAIYQLNCWINKDDIITPTLPRVSARTWRNTPFMLSLSKLADEEELHDDDEPCECPWLCEWPWLLWLWLWPCSWLPPILPPWECVCLNANIPNRFTHRPANDTYYSRFIKIINFFNI